MPTERKTVIEKKRVRITESVEHRATVHTLYDDAKDKFTSRDVPYVLDKESMAKAVDILRENFYWYHSAEGFDFWSDVIDRLDRISRASID